MPPTLPGPAWAFVDIAREKMAQAVRRLATARGIDPSDHCLVAYGGAAGAHAAGVAERLGIRVVLVHGCAAVLSAWGQALARRQVREVRALWTSDFDEVRAAWAVLLADEPGQRDCTVELRVRGTDHAIEVEENSEEQVLAAFHQEHARRYGYPPEGEIEFVNAWVRVRGPACQAPRVAVDPWELASPVAGPTVLFCPTTTIWTA